MGFSEPSATGEVARDLCEPVLFAHAVFVAREPDRGQSRGDDEQSRNEPHGHRIGTAPDDP